jgi:hypothetical protein
MDDVPNCPIRFFRKGGPCFPIPPGKPAFEVPAPYVVLSEANEYDGAILQSQRGSVRFVRGPIDRDDFLDGNRHWISPSSAPRCKTNPIRIQFGPTE